MTNSNLTNTVAGPVIQTRGLTRTFTARKQTVEAVRGLDLEIGQGELVAFLGPNGAGKSTTLRMLTTLLPPTSGSASVAGFDVATQSRQVRRSIGYVGQGNGAGHQQHGRDELISQARAHGLNRTEARARAEELIADFDLGACADRKVATLSGGQRRRMDIAIGLVHRPRVLFLDEPSTGLDPQNRANLQTQIQQTARRDRLHDRAHHPLPGGGRRARRPGDRGRSRTGHRRRHGVPPEGALLGDLITLGFYDQATAAAAAHRVRRAAPRPRSRRSATRSRSGWPAAVTGAGAGRRPGRRR